MKDEDIIELYWQRSLQAIPATTEKYGNYLMQIAYHILMNTQDAEECLNDTCFHAWNHIPPERPSYLKVFLGAIIRNLALDRYRSMRAKKRVPVEMTVVLSELESILPATGDVQQEIEEKELAVHISNFLREQTEEKRNIFIRRYWYCDDIKTIAKRFGCSESKIKASLFRSREQLKVYLEKEGIWI